MALLNRIDRLHLVKAVVDRVPAMQSNAAFLTKLMDEKLLDHKRYIERYGDDMPEIRDWRWVQRQATAQKR